MKIELINEKIVFIPETAFEETEALKFINKNSSQKFFNVVEINPLKED